MMLRKSCRIVQENPFNSNNHLYKFLIMRNFIGSLIVCWDIQMLIKTILNNNSNLHEVKHLTRTLLRIKWKQRELIKNTGLNSFKLSVRPTTQTSLILKIQKHIRYHLCSQKITVFIKEKEKRCLARHSWTFLIIKSFNS